MLILDLEIFRQYIRELQVHLFDDQTLNEIFEGIEKSHRKRRFVAVYILQSKEISHDYYNRRKDYEGLEVVFNQVLSCLFSEPEKKPLKTDFIRLLDLSPNMITGSVTSFQIKEMDKDLNNYLCYKQRLEMKG